METRKQYDEFATVLEEAADARILRVYGDVDLSRASEFEVAIDDAASSGDTVIIDFCDCRYIDSTAIGVIVRVVKRYGKRIRASVAQNSNIARVVSMVSLPDVLPVAFVKRP